jgi:hypothetical protein
MVKRIFLLAILFAFSTSCMKKQAFVPVYDVPPALESYIDSFNAEGAKRGQIFKKENLIMKYDQTTDGGLCGNCNSTSLEPDIQKIISVYMITMLNNSELERLYFMNWVIVLGRSHTSNRYQMEIQKASWYPAISASIQSITLLVVGLR